MIISVWGGGGVQGFILGGLFCKRLMVIKRMLIKEQNNYNFAFYIENQGLIFKGAVWG